MRWLRSCEVFYGFYDGSGTTRPVAFYISLAPVGNGGGRERFVQSPDALHGTDNEPLGD